MTGELGVGKSTLLSHCLHTIRAAERDTPVVCVSTDPFRRHLACDVWARVVVAYLRDVFRIPSLHDPEVRGWTFSCLCLFASFFCSSILLFSLSSRTHKVRAMLEGEANELSEFYSVLISALSFGYGEWEQAEESAGDGAAAAAAAAAAEEGDGRGEGNLVVGTAEHSALLRALLLAMVRACRARLGIRPMVVVIDAGLYVGDEGWQLALELLGERPVAVHASPPVPIAAYKRRKSAERPLSNALRLVVATRPLLFYTDAACHVVSPAFTKLAGLAVAETVAMETRMAPKTMSNLFLQNLVLQGQVRPTQLGKTALQLIQHLSVSNPSVVKELALAMSRMTPPQITVHDGPKGAKVRARALRAGARPARDATRAVRRVLSFVSFVRSLAVAFPLPPSSPPSGGAGLGANPAVAVPPEMVRQCQADDGGADGRSLAGPSPGDALVRDEARPPQLLPADHPQGRLRHRRRRAVLFDR